MCGVGQTLESHQFEAFALRRIVQAHPESVRELGTSDDHHEEGGKLVTRFVEAIGHTLQIQRRRGRRLFRMRVPIPNEMEPRFKHLFDLRVLLPTVGIKPRPSPFVGGVRPRCSNHPHFVASNVSEQLSAYFARRFTRLAVGLEMCQHFHAEGYDRPLLLGRVAELMLWQECRQLQRGQFGFLGQELANIRLFNSPTSARFAQQSRS